jgi:hypothetical protein
VNNRPYGKNRPGELAWVSEISGRTLASLFAVATVAVLAQQNEGPILRPKTQPAKPIPTATLLVMSDQACNWKLDGEAKGRIESGGSVKVRVDLSAQVVDASTDDAADHVQIVKETKDNGQRVIQIELKPVRDARLKSEQQAKSKADQEARDKLRMRNRTKPPASKRRAKELPRSKRRPSSWSRPI